MGRNDHACPICSKNFATCPHSWADRERYSQDERTRQIAQRSVPKDLTVHQRAEVAAIVNEILTERGL